ncbi:MAG: hypothetical protein V7K38_01090 [Nostoc sp.]|uniref:hypothetical protein n=1 Tax=Nostoc sp. TaxID=1180 RepID=UPI002FFBBD91
MRFDKCDRNSFIEIEYTAYLLPKISLGKNGYVWCAKINISKTTVFTNGVESRAEVVWRSLHHREKIG